MHVSILLATVLGAYRAGRSIPRSGPYLEAYLEFCRRIEGIEIACLERLEALPDGGFEPKGLAQYRTGKERPLRCASR